MAKVVSAHCTYKVTIILVIYFGTFKSTINSMYLLLNNV